MKTTQPNKESLKLKTKDILDVIYTQSHDEERHQRFLNRKQLNAHMARWFFDYEYNQLLWSDGLYEILELNPLEANASNAHILDLIHPDDIQLKIKAANLLKTAIKPLEITYRLVFPDGRIKWINEICSTEFDSNEKAIRSIGTIQDITRYKLAEEQFKQKENRFKKLIENLREGVVISENSKCIFMNTAAKKMLSRSNNTLISGKKFLSFVHPQNKEFYLNKLQLLVNSNDSTPFILKMLRQDGSEFTAQVTLSHTLFGNKPSVQIIFSDLTEKAKSDICSRENERRLQQEIETKDQLFSIIAHNLRNPLNSLLRTIDLMQNTFMETSAEKKKEYLNLIHVNASQALKLINELLDQVNQHE